MVNETVVRFASMQEEAVATLAGDKDARELQDALTEFYPFLANATFTESVDEVYNDETDEYSTVKTIVFAEKYGTKG